MGCIAVLLPRVVPDSTMGMTGMSHCREPSSLDERCSCEVVVVVGIAVLSSRLVTSVAFVLVVCVRSCCETSDGCGHWDDSDVGGRRHRQSAAEGRSRGKFDELESILVEVVKFVDPIVDAIGYALR